LQYKILQNQTKKVIAKVMKEEAEKEMEEMHEKSNKTFKLVKSLKKDGKDVEVRKWMKDKSGTMGFSEEDEIQK